VASLAAQGRGAFALDLFGNAAPTFQLPGRHCQAGSEQPMSPNDPFRFRDQADPLIRGLLNGLGCLDFLVVLLELMWGLLELLSGW
jgi:hypothetical protein